MMERYAQINIQIFVCPVACLNNKKTPACALLKLLTVSFNVGIYFVDKHGIGQVLFMGIALFRCCSSGNLLIFK